MQLRRGAPAIAVLVLALAEGGLARAQVASFDTSHTVFYEAPSHTHMFVYTPSADVAVSPWTWLDVRGGWDADVVSGASVATKYGRAFQATNPADVVTTASVHDVRNLGRGEFTVKGESTSLTAGYAYSTEHDYRSHSLHVNARTDAYQHNTQFMLSYARNFDEVCDRVQGMTDPTRFVALETSVGCFTHDPTRTTQPIAIDTFEASWEQAWTPVLETQLTYSAQLVDGFQADPYRSVVLGEGVRAQENEPHDRARHAVTARLAWYLRGVKGAIRLSLRGYYDTWAILSGTAELELEKSLGEAFRVMLRGRLYDQSGAVFWSDDYSSDPRGQFWTGDRELSPFWSWLGGVRAVWSAPPAADRIAGIFEGLKLVGSADVIGFDYLQYTLGGQPIANARAYVGTLSFNATF